MNLYSFIVAMLLGLAGAVAGYFMGHTKGVSQGAELGAGFAVNSSLNSFGFLELLEATMNSDIETSEPVKELMILNLESYHITRKLLSAPPFNQPYSEDLWKMDRETVDGAVARLKANRLRLYYEKQNKPSHSSPHRDDSK